MKLLRIYVDVTANWSIIGSSLWTWYLGKNVVGQGGDSGSKSAYRYEWWFTTYFSFIFKSISRVFKNSSAGLGLFFLKKEVLG